MLCGGSSGCAMVGAMQAARYTTMHRYDIAYSHLCSHVQAAKTLGKGQRCVVVLPDSVRATTHGSWEGLAIISGGDAQTVATQRTL